MINNVSGDQHIHNAPAADDSAVLNAIDEIRAELHRQGAEQRRQGRLSSETSRVVKAPSRSDSRRARHRRQI